MLLVVISESSLWLLELQDNFIWDEIPKKKIFFVEALILLNEKYQDLLKL